MQLLAFLLIFLMGISSVSAKRMTSESMYVKPKQHPNQFEQLLNAVYDVIEAKNIVILYRIGNNELQIFSEILKKFESRTSHSISVQTLRSGQNITRVAAVEIAMQAEIQTDVILISEDDQIIVNFTQTVIKKTKKHFMNYILVTSRHINLIQILQSCMFEEVNVIIFIGTKSRLNGQTETYCYMNQVNINGTSCLRYMGRWTQNGEKCQNTSLFHDKLMRYKSFNNRLMRVAAMKSLLAGINREKNVSELSLFFAGADREHLEYLAEVLRLRYVLIPTENGNEQIQFLSDRTGDFTIKNHMTIARSAFIEYASPQYVDNLLILTTPPEMLPHTTVLFRPFQVPVWLGVFSSVVIIGFSFSLFLIPFDGRYSKLGNGERGLSSTVRHIGFGFWFGFAAFIQEDQRSRTSLTGKGVLLFWSLLSFVLTTSYSGLLYSELANPVYETPIDTMEQLENAVRYDGWSFATTTGTAIESEFKHASGGFLKRMYELGKPHWAFWNVRTADIIDVVKRRKKHASVFNGYVMRLAYLSYGSKVFHMCKEPLEFLPLAMTFRHGCPFKKRFEEVNSRLITSGLLKYSQERHVIRRFQRAESTKFAISMGHLQAGFYLLFAGFALSVSAFAAEIIGKIMGKFQRKKKMLKSKIIKVLPKIKEAKYEIPTYSDIFQK